MGVFNIEPQQFADRVSFNHYLAENYETLVDGDMYVVSGLTEHPYEDFMDLLEADHYRVLEDYGAIKKMERSYGTGKSVEFYLSYDRDTNVVLFYTDMRKTEEIENTIEVFLRNTPGVHYLYISPRLLQEIREEIVADEETAQVVEFVAKRTERTETNAVFRPESARTINYYGEDGLESLREMEENYGVLPRIMEFKIPGGLRFRVNREGIFKLKYGDLNQLFEYIQLCIEESLKVKEAYEEADFQMVRASEKLAVPTSEPASITLRNTLEYHEIGTLKASMEDQDYVVLDSYAEEGSLYFSSKVIDELNNNVFRVKANEHEIRVFPQDGRDLGSFFRFYEFVQDSVDEYAELSAPA